MACSTKFNRFHIQQISEHHQLFTITMGKQPSASSLNTGEIVLSAIKKLMRNTGWTARTIIKFIKMEYKVNDPKLSRKVSRWNANFYPIFYASKPDFGKLPVINITNMFRKHNCIIRGSIWNQVCNLLLKSMESTCKLIKLQLSMSLGSSLSFNLRHIGLLKKAGVYFESIFTQLIIKSYFYGDVNGYFN